MSKSQRSGIWQSLSRKFLANYFVPSFSDSPSHSDRRITSPSPPTALSSSLVRTIPGESEIHERPFANSFTLTRVPNGVRFFTHQRATVSGTFPVHLHVCVHM